ncbi:MAG: hypothetical protein ABIN94_03645 [Ferruginibacter sp.]
MEKSKDIITAANSKTMNAVEPTKLFAAAAEEEQSINITNRENDVEKSRKASVEKKSPGKKKQKETK